MSMCIKRVLGSQNYLRLAFKSSFSCQRCPQSVSPVVPRYLSQQSTGARGYCTTSSDDTILPPLMDCPRLMWPEVLKTIKNWWFSYFFIRPQFDREFELNEFGQGAKQALEIISNRIANGEFEDLEGLVHDSALREIKENIAKFSVAQRQMLAVDQNDVFFAFPYEVGILSPERSQQFNYIEGKNDPPHKMVEIMVVFHVLRGMNRDKEELANKSMQEFVKDEGVKKRVMVCNYRFFRDFTEGQEPVWVVNLLNHYLPGPVNN